MLPTYTNGESRIQKKYLNPLNFEYNIKEKLRVTETDRSQQPPKQFYTKSTGKHLYQSLFFNKVAVLTLPGAFLLAGRLLLK